LLSATAHSNIAAPMTPAIRLVLLAAALVPYAALAGFDAWMHERDRRVPRLEQVLHGAAALTFLAFLFGVFRHHTLLALVSLCLFAAVSAWDELGFHGGLAARERRVHFAAYGALGLFVAVWALTSAAP
jgi:hypothetical protein